jgi:tetratricopeptide (TPR) repeat protein
MHRTQWNNPFFALLLGGLLIYGGALYSGDGELDSWPAERRSSLPELSEERRSEKVFLLEYVKQAYLVEEEDLARLSPARRNALSEKRARLFLKALSTCPESETALTHLVEERIGQDKLPQLLEELKKFIDRGDSSWETRGIYLNLLLEVGRMEEAKAMLDTLEGDDDHAPNLRILQATYYNKAGDFVHQKEIMDAALASEEIREEPVWQIHLLPLCLSANDTENAEKILNFLETNEHFLQAPKEYAEVVWNALASEEQFGAAAAILQFLLENGNLEPLSPAERTEIFCQAFAAAFHTPDLETAQELLALFPKLFSAAHGRHVLHDLEESLYDAAEGDTLDGLPPERIHESLQICALIGDTALRLRAPARTDDITLLRLAQIHVLLGEYAQAHKLLLLLRDPHLEVGNFLLVVHLMAQDLPRAEKIYNDLLQNGNPLPSPLLCQCLAQNLEEAGRLRDGIAVLEQAHALYPNDVGVANSLGYTYALHTNRLNEAAELLVFALSEKPDNPAYLDSLAWIRFRQKDFRQALVLQCKCLWNLPKDQELLEQDHSELFEHFTLILLANLLPAHTLHPSPAP